MIAEFHETLTPDDCQLIIDYAVKDLKALTVVGSDNKDKFRVGEGTWDGGKEKAPAAICRKIASLPKEGGEIEVWGDGNQTRSFLYIDECIEATRLLMKSDYGNPVNIGSEEMVTINELAEITASVSGKDVRTKHLKNAPLGVRGRNSNNDLIRNVLKWDSSISLKEGIGKTYEWIDRQVAEDVTRRAFPA